MVRQRADARAHEAVDRVPDRFEHPAHLPVPAFRNHQSHHAVRLAVARIEYLGMGGKGPPAVERDAAPQPRQRVRIRHTRHVGLIGPLDAMTRVGEERRQIAIVGQDEQAFRVVVEPAHRVHILRDPADELHDRAALLRVAEGRHDPTRLVEQDVAAARLGLHAASVHADVIGGEVGLRAELQHRPAVDRDAAVHDERFRRPA